MVRVERVDNSMYWNVSIGTECVGLIKVENYKLTFKPAINSFAPELSYVQRCNAITEARNSLSDKEFAQIKCGGDLELVDHLAEFLADCGVDESEVEEQAIAMIKGLKKNWKINKI